MNLKLNINNLLTTFLFFVSFVAFSNLAFAQNYNNNGVLYPELCNVFNRTLKQGDVGEDVKRLQIVLGQEGVAYLGGTGYYGPLTTKAVETFQSRAGIYPVGKVGPQTLTRMKNLWCGGTNINNNTNNSNPNNPYIYNNNNNNNNNNYLDPSVPNISFGPTSSNGNNITLTWTTTGTQSCNINGENVATNGNRTYPVNQETPFTITCFDYSNKKTERVIYVKPNTTQNVVPIVNLYLNPNNPIVGNVSTLNWTSQNANSCTLNGGTVSLSGNQQFTVPTNSTTYTLTCYGTGGGSATQSITSTGTIINGTNNNLSVVLTTDKSNYTVGETINSTARITNNGNTNVEFYTGVCDRLNITINNYSFSSYFKDNINSNNQTSCIALAENHKVLPGQTITINSSTMVKAYNYNNQNSNGNKTLSISFVDINNKNYSAQNTFTVNSGTTSSNSLNMTVSMNKSNFNIGENFTLNVLLQNNTANSLSYLEPICSIYGPFNITLDGNDFYSSIDDRIYNACPPSGNTTITLSPGQSKNYTFTGTIANRTYTTGNKNVQVTLQGLSGGTSLVGNVSFTINSVTTGLNAVGISSTSLNAGNTPTITWLNTSFANAKGVIFDLIDLNGIVVGTIKRLPEYTNGAYQTLSNNGQVTWTVPKSIRDSRNDAITCQIINGESLCGNLINTGSYKIRATYFTPVNACFGFCPQIADQQILGINESSSFTINRNW